MMSTLSFLFASVVMLTNAVDVTSAVHRSVKGASFDLRGMISPYVPNHSCFLITDASGSTRIEYKGNANTEQLQNGDIIRAVGTINPYPSGMGIAICSQFTVETHRKPPPVAEVSIAEIKSGKYDNLPVKVQGTIKEVFRDDIDPLWYYMILTDGDKSIYMTLHSDCADLDAVQRMTGAFVAQNLTGVSLEIDTAGKLVETDPKAMREHLGQATRTLKSCRDELRNCIWDLRNRALEEASMDEAIRQTLAPHIVGVEVAIRFNVPRERISDNTAHAILRSIRELTINAVRHGKATKIWIAGSIDGDKLLFSVRDNGIGFDPATAPGFAEGHYGLVGITERVESLEGELNIESSPGRGTKATVKLKMQHS